MFEKYDMLIPQGVIFNLKEIEDMKIIKSDMAKKLIYNNELEVVKMKSSLMTLTGKAFVDGKLTAEAELKAMIVDK